MSGFLANGHLSRGSCQLHLLDNFKGENEVKPGTVDRSPGIYHKVEEYPRIPQLAGL